MGKKNAKEAAKMMIEKKLGSLLVNLDPTMGKKKLRNKVTEARKILIKGIKLPKASFISEETSSPAHGKSGTSTIPTS